MASNKASSRSGHTDKKCLQCNRSINVIHESSFCNSKCQYKFALKREQENKENPPIYIRINSKTLVSVKNPTKEKIKETEDKWREILGDNMGFEIITPIKTYKPNKLKNL